MAVVVHSTDVGKGETAGTLTLYHSFSFTAALLAKAARSFIKSQKAENAVATVLNWLNDIAQRMHLWGTYFICSVLRLHN